LKVPYIFINIYREEEEEGIEIKIERVEENKITER